VTDSHATQGGGIAVDGANAEVNATHVVFEGCEGGALWASNGATVTVKDSFFRANGSETGGAVGVQDATYISSGTTYRNNEAYYGSALFFSNATVNMTNDVLIDNGEYSSLSAIAETGASNGGAIVIHGGDVTIVNSTIVDNAASNGGGIYDNSSDRDVDLTLVNSIIYGNESTALDDVSENIELATGTGTLNVVGYNNLTSFDGWTDGADNILYTGELDAVFADIANHDPRLADNSPAIDAGNAELAEQYSSVDLSEDYLSAERAVGEAIDLGAFEYGAEFLYALSAPSQFTLGELSEETLQLPSSWSAVEGATRYRVEATTTLNPTDDDFWFSTNVDDISRIAQLTSRSVQYTFRVRAEISYGAEPEAISEWTYATFTPSAPSAPGSISFDGYSVEFNENGVAVGKLEMSWGDVSRETAYRVEAAKGANPSESDFWYSATLSADDVDRIATLTAPSDVYTFRVCALNGAARSEWTYATFTPSAPSAPESITFGAYDQATGKLEMSWAKSDSAIRYRVEATYGENATDGFWFSQYVTGGATERIATLGNRYGAYTFRVRAELGSNYSDWTYGTYTPAPMEAPTGPTSVVFDSYNPETRQLTMSWDGVSSNANKIRVEFTYDGGNTWSHSQTLAGDATGRIATLGEPSRTYQFRVCAINDANKDDSSAWEWTYSDTFKASEWKASSSQTDAISAAFSELFSDDSDDDFWGLL
ncbi:MAG: hypothetical protein IJ387_14010, partial [Thermoguttaceae bacterium]|nr:hypothetical protein [Thermoguttaceae bacterium]